MFVKQWNTSYFCHAVWLLSCHGTQCASYILRNAFNSCQSIFSVRLLGYLCHTMERNFALTMQWNGTLSFFHGNQVSPVMTMSAMMSMFPLIHMSPVIFMSLVIPII